jgi:hypothetical protein
MLSFRRLNNFGRHLMVWVCWMATKIFQSPSIATGISDKDYIFFVTISHTPNVQWQSNFLVVKKRGHVTCF